MKNVGKWEHTLNDFLKSVGKCSNKQQNLKNYFTISPNKFTLKFISREKSAKHRWIYTCLLYIVNNTKKRSY